MNWLVTSKKNIFLIECIYLVSTNNKNQALSIYRMPIFWKMISQEPQEYPQADTFFLTTTPMSLRIHSHQSGITALSSRVKSLLEENPKLQTHWDLTPIESNWYQLWFSNIIVKILVKKGRSPNARKSQKVLNINFSSQFGWTQISHHLQKFFSAGCLFSEPFQDPGQIWMDPPAVSFGIANIKVRKLEVNGRLMHKFMQCQLDLAWHCTFIGR